jgi:hypothetical protein
MHSQIVFGVLFVDAAVPYDWTSHHLGTYLGMYVSR